MEGWNSVIECKHAGAQEQPQVSAQVWDEAVPIIGVVLLPRLIPVVGVEQVQCHKGVTALWGFLFTVKHRDRRILPSGAWRLAPSEMMKFALVHGEDAFPMVHVAVQLIFGSAVLSSHKWRLPRHPATKTYYPRNWNYNDECISTKHNLHPSKQDIRILSAYLHPTCDFTVVSKQFSMSISLYVSLQASSSSLGRYVAFTFSIERPKVSDRPSSCETVITLVPYTLLKLGMRPWWLCKKISQCWIPFPLIFTVICNTYN